jgi:hypothetical protein
VAPCSGEGWGFYGHLTLSLGKGWGALLIAVDSQALLDKLACLPLIEEWGNNLIALCSSALWQIYKTLYLLFRMQIYTSFSGCRDHSALHGGWDSHSSALGLQTQQKYIFNLQGVQFMMDFWEA